MNKEGYRDPTAESAVRNASRAEKPMTRKQLIDACWNHGDKGCGSCRYTDECHAFSIETGKVPRSFTRRDAEYSAVPEKMRRVRKKW